MRVIFGARITIIILIQLLTVVVGFSLAIFLGFYLLYFVICLRYVRARPPRSENPNPDYFPRFSMIIPVYNEASVIPRKFQNLGALRYRNDKMEIVFVDSGSVDGTAELIATHAKTSDLGIKIVRQATRMGFNSAVIAGFAKTTGDIICITGAETEYEPETLQIMIRHFRDPRVGAVTGRMEIKNSGRGLSPKLETEYRRLYDFMREAESCIDSPFDIKGEISAARRSICEHLVQNPRLYNKGCIDACLSFQAKKDGYKTVFEPSAVYSELSPSSIRDSFKQQIRRAATLIENMMAFKDMILSRRFGAFGLLIMPAHFLMLTILPLLLLSAAVGSLALLGLDPSNYLLDMFVFAGLVGILTSRRIQAFFKAQVALLFAVLGLAMGIETQKFARLSTTRQ